MGMLMLMIGLSGCHEHPDAGGWVFHLNIRGYSGGGGPVNVAVGLNLLASIDSRSPKPASITLNEVCSNQLGYNISSGLTSRGYIVQSLYGSYIDSSCGYFGNLVATRLPYAGYEGLLYPSSNGRNVFCLRVTGYVGGQICTTHLSPRDPPGERAKRNTQLGHLNGYLASRPILALGADLNILHNESQIDTVYSQGLKGGTGGPPPSSRATHTSGQRLDYIFVNALFFTPHMPGRIRGPLPNTDHYLYEAFLQ